MSLYQKKPVAVEAFQYDGDFKGTDGNYYVPDWAVEALEQNILYWDGPDLMLLTDGIVIPVDVGDYIVKFPEGHIITYKLDMFSKYYNHCDVMDSEGLGFGEALQGLKEGKSISRAMWGPDSATFVFLGKAKINKSTFSNSQDIEVLPAFCMKTGDNTLITGWLPSAEDILAVDWRIFILE